MMQMISPNWTQPRNLWSCEGEKLLVNFCNYIN